MLVGLRRIHPEPAALCLDPMGLERGEDQAVDLPAVQHRVGVPTEVGRRRRGWLVFEHLLITPRYHASVR